MPTINRLPRKPKNNNHKQTEKRKLRQKAYNSSKWRRLREAYMKRHPICEQCNKNAAEDIHHLKSFIVGNEIDWNLFLDENNLQALCKECHGNIHSHKITDEKKYMEEDENGRFDFFTL